MRNQRKYFLIFLLASLLLMRISTAFAILPQPSSFYGTVKVDGANVAEGTPITGWINGVKYGETSAMIFMGDSVYNMDVLGDDPETSGTIEGGEEGDMIIFQVGDLVADQTGTWHSGTSVELNLTGQNPKYIFLPLVNK